MNTIRAVSVQPSSPAPVRTQVEELQHVAQRGNPLAASALEMLRERLVDWEILGILQRSGRAHPRDYAEIRTILLD